MRANVAGTALVLVAILLVAAQGAPFAFRSQQHPNSLLIKVELQPEHEFRVRSASLMPRGNHWTTLNSFGPNIASEPSIAHGSILFNDQHDGKYVLAFYDQNSLSKVEKNKFNYIETDHDQGRLGWLLPMFAQEMPAFRVDRLFRCEDTLVSVEWKGRDAHVVAFSWRSHQWNILESIDGGYTGEDGGVRYAYAVDKEHERAVVVDVGKKYCEIGRETQPARVDNTWNEEYYGLQDIMDLISDKLELLRKDKPTEEEL